jgi:hypothetical protein
MADVMTEKVIILDYNDLVKDETTPELMAMIKEVRADTLRTAFATGMHASVPQLWQALPISHEQGRNTFAQTRWFYFHVLRVIHLLLGEHCVLNDQLLSSAVHQMILKYLQYTQTGTEPNPI